jgi:hypothetical protein
MKLLLEAVTVVFTFESPTTVKRHVFDLDENATEYYKGNIRKWSFMNTRA